MTHEELQDLLEAYVDETLDRATRAEVDRHLAGCDECRAIILLGDNDLDPASFDAIDKLFSLSGSSVIVSPYRDSHEKIVGVLGVVGPTRLNYARIIPMVDYTAKIIGKLIS